MNIMELLELGPDASRDLIAQRIEEKRRYFTSLAKSAPTRTLSEIYQRRLAELDEFGRQSGLAPVSAQPLAPAPTSGDAAARPVVTFLLRPAEPAGAAGIELRPGLNVIGREPRNLGNPIALEDDFVSKNHAVLEIVPGPPPSVYLYDIGEIAGKPSTNGVFLNGSDQRLDGRVEIGGGDSIRVGHTTLVLERLDHATPPPAAQPGEHDRTVILKAPYK